MKSFGQLTNAQIQREDDFLSRLMSQAGMEDLAYFETDLAERQKQVLFELTTKIEDTENALKQAEHLVQRLKKHLEQLKGLQRVLSK